MKFLDNLSAAMLRLCDAQDLNYERAADRCSISSRHFGNIVRRESAPTITVLEKICDGLETTPNALLLSPSINRELTFRNPMAVERIDMAGSSTGSPVCPRCGNILEKKHQKYCDDCGQYLGW